MSLIQTARVNGENPFEYLTALQRNAAAVRKRPAEWLPWNYRATLAAIEARRAAESGPGVDARRVENVVLRSPG